MTDLNWYEVGTHTLIMRNSSTETFNWTVTLVRTGNQVLYAFPDAGLITIQNAPRNIVSDNAVPTQFRPSTHQAFPHLLYTGGGIWQMGKMIIRSDGVVELQPLNGQFENLNWFYPRRCSVTIYIA